MKQQIKKPMQSGFTLIELLMVIAILAIITVIGIHSYGNLRDVQAKKMNVTNIKSTYNALATYNLMKSEEGELNYFDYFDSLIDAKEGSGAWTETAGTYRWSDVAVSGVAGIYDGSWKFLGELTNAGGKSMKTYTEEDLPDIKEQNKGTRNTGLLSLLGIYFLSSSDAELVRAAGIRNYMLHNPSVRQSSSYAKLPDTMHTVGGGGPGFRPDMSAYYPAEIQAGTPVAIIRPITSGRGSASASTIYKDFGYEYTGTNTLGSADTDLTNMLSTLGVRLICFGIGQNAECVRDKYGLGEAPYNPVYDKRNYRQYLAVFALTSGGQGVSGKCSFIGVLDCSGNTYRAASYSKDWTTEL